MKSTVKKIKPALILLGFLTAKGFSQGFYNLAFESAKIIPIAGNPYYPYGIAVSNAMPGWTVTGFGDTNAATWITYNDPAAGSSWVNLWATNGQQIGGSFSVLLQGGIGTGVSIAQTGLVPSSAQSLEFEAQPGNGTLLVSLGGQNLAYSAIATGANYTLYAASISGFSGLNETLMLSAVGYNGGGGVNNWNIDNIQFSSTPAPEPGAWALTGLGGGLLGWRVRRKVKTTN